MKKAIFLGLVFTSAITFAKGKPTTPTTTTTTTTTTATNCTNYSQFADVPKAEMTKIVDAKGATIVDVNSAESFKKNHIPGAVHFEVVKADFAKALPADKNAPIVAYCGGKQCTAWQQAAKMACEMGYKNIRHFSEGISGWQPSKKI